MEGCFSMNEQQIIRWKGNDPRKYNEAGYLLGDFFEGLEQYTTSPQDKENIINKFVTEKSELYKFADNKILSESEKQSRNQQL